MKKKKVNQTANEKKKTSVGVSLLRINVTNCSDLIVGSLAIACAHSSTLSISLLSTSLSQIRGKEERDERKK